MEPLVRSVPTDDASAKRSMGISIDLGGPPQVGSFCNCAPVMTERKDLNILIHSLINNDNEIKRTLGYIHATLM